MNSVFIGMNGYRNFFFSCTTHEPKYTKYHANNRKMRNNIAQNTTDDDSPENHNENTKDKRANRNDITKCSFIIKTLKHFCDLME